MKNMAFENQEKKDLVSYFSSLPTREELVKKLADVTCSDVSSVYRWVNGKVIPPALKQKVIAEFLESEIEILFPNQKSE